MAEWVSGTHPQEQRKQAIARQHEKGVRLIRITQHTQLKDKSMRDLALFTPESGWGVAADTTSAIAHDGTEMQYWDPSMGVPNLTRAAIDPLEPKGMVLYGFQNMTDENWADPEWTPVPYTYLDETGTYLAERLISVSRQRNQFWPGNFDQNGHIRTQRLRFGAAVTVVAKRAGRAPRAFALEYQHYMKMLGILPGSAKTELSRKRAMEKAKVDVGNGLSVWSWGKVEVPLPTAGQGIVLFRKISGLDRAIYGGDEMFCSTTNTPANVKNQYHFMTREHSLKNWDWCSNNALAIQLDGQLSVSDRIVSQLQVPQTQAETRLQRARKPAAEPATKPVRPPKLADTSSEEDESQMSASVQASGQSNAGTGSQKAALQGSWTHTSEQRSSFAQVESDWLPTTTPPPHTGRRNPEGFWTESETDSTSTTTATKSFKRFAASPNENGGKRRRILNRFMAETPSPADTDAAEGATVSNANLNVPQSVLSTSKSDTIDEQVRGTRHYLEELIEASIRTPTDRVPDTVVPNLIRLLDETVEPATGQQIDFEKCVNNLCLARDNILTDYAKTVERRNALKTELMTLDASLKDKLIAARNVMVALKVTLHHKSLDKAQGKAGAGPTNEGSRLRSIQERIQERIRTSDSD